MPFALFRAFRNLNDLGKFFFYIHIFPFSAFCFYLPDELKIVVLPPCRLFFSYPYFLLYNSSDCA